MRTRIALQLNAIVGLVSAAAAVAMIGLVLTRPADVAATVAQHDYTALALAVASELAGWVRVLVHFL